MEYELDICVELVSLWLMVWKIVKVFDSVLDWDLAIGIWDWKDRTKMRV